ncbi:MAG: dipeptidase [Bacteroidales bacterium]|nr:dipeptidase [Bacteroidales bacterium]
METKFVDLHCHPSLKPFGKSFKKIAGKNNPDISKENSIWYYDPPTVFDKFFNIVASLTKFTQSDFSTMSYGNAHVIFVSLYPLEKGFVVDKLGTGLGGDLLKNLVMGISKKRIDHLQEMDDYFTDLESIYDYYKQLDGEIFRLKGKKHRYIIISNFAEIENDINTEVKTIYVVFTIEGANVFNSGLINQTANEDEILTNIDKVKNWDNKLFFIGMAHHFYNELCGHAQSLHGIPEMVSDQTDGMNSGFTDLGIKVLHRLLDNTNGKRVLIDIKHMSVDSRNKYYQMLEDKYATENIPLVVSHGAVNGLRSDNEKVIDNHNTKGKFQEDDINIYDDEIIRIARSNGIFGIQLDERRVANKDELKKAGNRILRKKMLSKRSKLLWNQIQHIAEILDKAGLFAWSIQSVGSDFDGLINPLNGFWTAKQMSLLSTYLLKHAEAYLASPQSVNLNQNNRISAEEIIERFIHNNAYEFLRRNF